MNRKTFCTLRTKVSPFQKKILVVVKANNSKQCQHEAPIRDEELSDMGNVSIRVEGIIIIKKNPLILNYQ